jgi:hypothetical protein
MNPKILGASLLLLGGCASSGASTGDQLASLSEHVLFYSSFDGSTTAEVAVGDPNFYTADSLPKRETARAGLHDPAVSIAAGQGLYGDALEFTARNRQLTYYRATENLGYSTDSWSGAVSMWLQLDPATDLEPGYCDLIQITDVAFNDASIWVDFTKENPRSFRLGVIGDLEAWNPDKKNPHESEEFARRLIPVEAPPFQRGTWTHILINFGGLNSESGTTELFVDGVSMGSLAVTDPFTWEPEKALFMLGLGYIGLMDELAVFDRPLTAAEIGALRGGKPLRALLH